MTNLQEAKLAREAEICYVTVAMVTDYDCWHPEHDAVEVDRHHPRAEAECRERLPAWSRKRWRRCPPERTCKCGSALQHALITDRRTDSTRHSARSWSRLSESISCSDRALSLLYKIRGSETWPRELVHSIGEECPGAFFRIVVESLADSFEPAQAEAYTQLMGAWNLAPASSALVVPDRVDAIFVLSRVTLGADIKVTSVILDCMKRRFPEARVVLVANRKSAELFAADPRIEHLVRDYPRRGPVSEKLEFARSLTRALVAPNRIVIDPDSRLTQLGLAAVCERERYFHFPSRTVGNDSAANLSDLTRLWLEETFGATGHAYVAVEQTPMEGPRPRAAVSLGVGENETKRIEGDFEARLIRLLGQRYPTLWIDRGAGGEESRRVTAAVAASGVQDRVRFWEGSFAGFVSIVEQGDLYVGYDSGGQHAAAAVGTPLVSIFKGAPSERFRNRWMPRGDGAITVIDADSLSPDECLTRLQDSSDTMACL